MQAVTPLENMHCLTPLESKVATGIERHRALNPDGLSALEWIEGSEMTQRAIADAFGTSQKTISNLCQHLAVERNLAGVRGPEPHVAINKLRHRIITRFERKRAIIADCLRLAREGNGLATLGLEIMGIKILK